MLLAAEKCALCSIYTFYKSTMCSYKIIKSICAFSISPSIDPRSIWVVPRLKSLFWALMLLGVVIYVFAVLFTSRGGSTQKGSVSAPGAHLCVLL